MNDVTRALLVLLFIIVCFGLSYWSYDHIDNSYLMNEPEHVVELEPVLERQPQVLARTLREIDTR